MATPLKAVRPVTDEELLELAERNPGYQFERLADGEIIVTPTGGDSARQEAELARQLGNWARQSGRGLVLSPSAMLLLPDGSRLMPDSSWVRRGRWDALSPEERRGFIPLCPDAVFEIRSAGQPLSVLRNKMRTYLTNGARIGVLIDPYGRIVEVYRPGQEPEIRTNPATVALDPELPGFVLDLGPIFET
jgi:Uma2 family endonuclease